jgi:SAM-dependent methyltransferase
MAVWLAEQVGESGKVVATDIDVTYLERIHLSNLEVCRHNILEDSVDALGPGSFDMVCARLTLFWLADKQESAIQHMVECLRPGGWLVDEDGDWGTLAPVDPSHAYYGCFNCAYRAGEWWTSRGYDPTFGRKLPVLFERCGLESICHEATAEVVRGGSPWARWWQETFVGLHEWEQREHGLTEAQEEEYKALTVPWTDPSFWFLNALIHACRGQRPKQR